MAACFSTSRTFSTPPVCVLSRIPNLTLCLQAFALPGMQVKNIPISVAEGTVLDEENLSLIKEVEIAVCDVDLFIKTHKYMPNLKWAHCTWAGVEGLFKAIPEQPSFTVTRHGGEAFCKLMSEYVVCQILNCERQFKLCWKTQDSKIWLQPDTFDHYRSLDQLKVAILGVGSMASSIAEFLHMRKCSVYGFARSPRGNYEFSVFNKISTNLDDVIVECDYLCNTLPSTPLTSGILNCSVLQKCQKKPVFINVGRGSVISESELVKALKSGLLSGAVLDVFETEPLPETSELWDMPQVTITPHVSSLSRANHIAEDFFRQAANYIDGHGLQNVVNWSIGY